MYQKNSVLGVPSGVRRPAFFMTNMLMVAGGVAATGTLYAPTANRPVAMIDIRDVAAVAAVTLTADGHDKQVYDLTGPSAVTFGDVARAIGAGIVGIV